MSGPPRQAPRNVLTVDVEDWQQSTLDTDLPLSDRVVSNTRRLLDIFDRAAVRATFFVLGLVAERFPLLVREIAARGHEIASHGTSHLSVSSLGPEGFRKDLRRSIESIEAASGRKVVGYRAPDFSISESAFWALEIMAEEGLLYDSSLFPFRGPRYGVPNAFRDPFVIQCRSTRTLLEFPLATVELMSRRFPIAGGGYFRLFPYAVTRAALRWMNQKGTVATFYVHPYEIDVDEFRAVARPVPLGLRISQGIGRRSVGARLSRLLADFSWVPARELLEENALFAGRHVDISDRSGKPQWVVSA
jgi:polysaccharide deacetylase family protein (PEP-CTERM system associated)